MITREMVEVAAAAIQAEGRQPTVRAVRARTGGSLAAVIPHMRAWKLRRAELGIAARAGRLPETLAERLRAVGQAAWDAGRGTAETELREARERIEALEREVEVLRAERGVAIPKASEE